MNDVAMTIINPQKEIGQAPSMGLNRQPLFCSPVLVLTELRNLGYLSLNWLNSLPNDKILEWSKWKAFADDNHMPILGSSNSAANKDMMSKIRPNGDISI